MVFERVLRWRILRGLSPRRGCRSWSTSHILLRLVNLMTRRVHARPLHRVALFAATLLAIFHAAAAHAVPPEYFRSIALHPTNPDVFAVRYDNAYGGLLFSRDGGKSMQLLPARYFYYYSLQRWVPMIIAGDGKLQVALDEGLALDDGNGCIAPPGEGETQPSDPAVKGLWVADVTLHPTEPETSFLLTTGDTKTAHAGVWRRKQGTLAPLGTSEPLAAGGKLAFYAGSLRVVARAASTEGIRFVETGLKNDYSTMPMASTPVLRISDDLGKTWTTSTIPDPMKTGGTPRIVLVDGSEPFKAIVAIENGFGDESDDPIDPLFVTKDGGQTFAPYLDQVKSIGEAALLPSGQVLVADRSPEGGLWSATNFDSSPTKIADFSVRCLAYQPQTKKVFMCKFAELGYYDPAAKTFCTIYSMKEATGFVSCPGAPVAQSKKVIDQLCGGWCGAAHYASSAICSSFVSEPGRICGPAAYAYDNNDPNPDKRWIEPPGANGSPRCTGFPARLTTGMGTMTGSDGGTDATLSDAGGNDGGSTALDAGAQTSADADEPQSPGGGGAVPEKKKSGGGCHVSPRVGSGSGGSNTGLASSFLLVLAVAARGRHRRRAQRAVA